MIRIKSPALLFLFAIVIAFPLSVSPQRTVSLTWEVQKYDISATLPADTVNTRDLDVTAVLTIKNISSSPASRLTMRISDAAAVTSVSAGGTAADFAASEEGTGGSRPLQRVAARIPSVAPGGSIEVSVNYKLNVKENSGLNSLAYAGSQFLPGSFWYPTPTSWFYNGGPDFAPFSLKISAPADVKLFSSGASSGQGFEQALNGQPFFVAGPYESSVSEGVEVVYVRRGQQGVDQARVAELASIAAKANTFIGEKLGRDPLADLRIVCVRRGSGFSDSGTMLIDDSVLVRDKIDSQAAATIIEGVAKAYLGNLISVNGDGYGVIREGFARYLSNEFIESEYGKDVAEVERLRQRTAYTAISRRDAPLNIISPVDGYFYTAAANKGSQVWAYLAAKHGNRFDQVIRELSADNAFSLADVRAAFGGDSAYFDYAIDKVTDMNLMVGLPQTVNGTTRSALRNLGEVDANVVILARTRSGKEIRQNVNVRAGSFGEAVFQSDEPIDYVEVDEKKLYPQVDYADDIAPRAYEDSDPLIYIKKEFDRQKYAEAEANAAQVLRLYPQFHDARILLARSQLASGKLTEASRNFEMVLSSPLPSPQSIAWAQLGLGEIAKRSGASADTVASRLVSAITSDAEYGTTLGGLQNLLDAGTKGTVEKGVTDFFVSFDRAVVSNSKADVVALIEGGEIARFASSVAGQAQEWTTRVDYAFEVDAVDVIVCTRVTLRLLNREVESGLAVFRLSRTPGGYRLSGVEIFEVS